jgi:2'-5' RNA ligase
MNEAEFERAWQRFQEAQTLRLLQETQEWEWTRGRRDYAAFLFPVPEGEVRQHIAAQIERLAGIPGIDPYPESYWHVTIKGVGFVCDEPSRADEISGDDLSRLASGARGILESISPFEVVLGPVNAFEEVVFLEVHDRGVVRDLNRRLIEALPGLPMYPVDGEAFLPHISIARFSSGEGLGQLKQALGEMRAEAGRSSFGVEDVMLVQAHLSAEAPTLDLISLYSLGGG